MTRSNSHRRSRALAAMIVAASLSLASALATQAATTDTITVTLRSATAQPAVPGVNADIRLLRHTMPGVGGIRQADADVLAFLRERFAD